MNPLIRLKQKTSVFAVGLGLVCFGLATAVQALSPAPDGGYPNFTTAEGDNALNGLTTGAGNTGIGWYSLFGAGASNFNTGLGAGTLVLNAGDSNTAAGAGALLLNTSGRENTAVGTDALVFNSIGNFNDAFGAFALFNNIDGVSNNAVGDLALFSNIHAGDNTAIGDAALTNNDVTGSNLAIQNTAVGALALYSNTDGSLNTAVGYQALFSNTTGFSNTATGSTALGDNATGTNNTANGVQALVNNTTGSFNTAIGQIALFSNSTGSANTALGAGAGSNDTTGSNNVYLGAGLIGVAGESNACYIASISGQPSADGVPVLINADNKLGTTTSSRRFKEDIKPMNKTSESLFGLKPVTFRYKKELDPHGAQQWGLVAEDVQKLNPDLVALDKEGRPYAVRYDQVNAMLLNEFLKEHKAFVEEETKVQDQGATIIELKKQIEALTAGLQKVSAQLELNKSAPQRP